MSNKEFSAPSQYFSVLFSSNLWFTTIFWLQFWIIIYILIFLCLKLKYWSRPSLFFFPPHNSFLSILNSLKCFISPPCQIKCFLSPPCQIKCILFNQVFLSPTHHTFLSTVHPLHNVDGILLACLSHLLSISPSPSTRTGGRPHGCTTAGRCGVTSVTSLTYLGNTLELEILIIRG